MTAWIPVVALILGLLLWALAAQPVVKEAGRIMYACGLLVTLFKLAASSVSLLR